MKEKEKVFKKNNNFKPLQRWLSVDVMKRRDGVWKETNVECQSESKRAIREVKSVERRRWFEIVGLWLLIFEQLEEDEKLRGKERRTAGTGTL